MSETPNFPPKTTLTLPVGAGALEHVVAHIRKFDPTFTYFSIFALRQWPRLDRFGGPDSLPDIYADLRPPITLSLPPGEVFRNQHPNALAQFSNTNGHEVTLFLQSLHDQARGAANFWTYAIFVFFRPGYKRVDLTASTRPHRLFSGAPLSPSFTVLATSGNRLALFSAQDSKRYLELFNERPYRLQMDSRGWEAVDTDALLPYLAFPFHTTDVSPEGGLTIPEPDNHSQQWLKWISDTGVALETHPSRVFDKKALEELKQRVSRSYRDWLNQGVEFTRSVTDRVPCRFGRTKDYLRQRYPRLRDWLNHALIGTATTTKPTWNLQMSTPPPMPTGASLLSDFVLGPEEEDPGLDLLADEAKQGGFYPNMLSRVAQEAFMHLQRYFLLSVGERPPGISYQAIEAELRLMLVTKGMLRALLTEIGDTQCS